MRRLVDSIRRVFTARTAPALSRELALLRRVADSTDVMLAYFDCALDFVWVNQAYASSCRMRPEDMIGRNHFALFPDPENEAIFRRVRDTATPAFFRNKPFEFGAQPERGVTYWDWTLTPDTDAAGKVVGLVISARETTRFVRAEQMARESEGRFTALADAAPVLIWMSDTSGKCSWFNEQWLRFTGRTMAQELGNGWAEGVHPEDVERCLDIYTTRFAEQQPFEMDYRLRAASGEYRWIVDQAVPRYDAAGNFQGYVGACADITERRRAEAALRENEQKLSLFIDGVPVGIAMFDAEMRYIAVSQSFVEAYRLPPAQSLIGCSHYEIFPDIPERWRQIHRRCLAGETMRCDEDAFVRQDGNVDWVRWEIRPWFEASGKVGGLILFAEDITARKRAEQEIRAARTVAEKANSAKSRFLAAASHDLRQPLTALSLYIGVLDRHVDSGGKALLDNLKTCVGSLSQLLTDLLDYSKLEAGVVTATPRDFAVDDVLRNLAIAHRPEAQLKGLRLRCVRPQAIAHTDPVLFQRIVGNFVENAVRYTEHGGVLIGCRRREGRTWVEVWDSGIGIASEQIDEIFEEFKQLGDQARTRGSGLGLAIAAKTATLLGLKIRVRSWPGRGSVFAVELPRKEAAAAPALQKPDPLRRSLRIALVEDNDMVRTALLHTLHAAGHEVIAAATGKELHGKLLASAPPDLVLSDYRLAQGETGFDVIKTVRTALGEQVPAILVTGDTDPALVRSMADRGIVVVHKPLNMEILQAYLKDLTHEGEHVPG